VAIIYSIYNQSGKKKVHQNIWLSKQANPKLISYDHAL